MVETTSAKLGRVACFFGFAEVARVVATQIAKTPIRIIHCIAVVIPYLTGVHLGFEAAAVPKS
jgi:hypothetical protein